MTAAHQAPLSLGFSRQEHWGGLPFPSPMHESEKWKVKVKSLSHVRLLATPWTAAYQAPPSMGFSRQEYWSGVPLPSPNVCYMLGKKENESRSRPFWVECKFTTNPGKKEIEVQRNLPWWETGTYRKKLPLCIFFNIFFFSLCLTSPSSVL